MPCGSGTVTRGVALTADGTLDLNLQSVTVTGRVTLKGATMPDQTRTRGSLTFRGSRDASAGGTTGVFASTGDVTYRLILFPGMYDVLYNGDQAGCTQTSPAPLFPCNSGLVKQAVTLTTSGVLDVDIPMVKVTGAVTLNGATMPDATTSRGSLTFGATGNAAVPTTSFGATGAVTYAVALIPGSYAVSLVATPSLCGPTLMPEVPCLGGTLMSSVALTADGVLNVDMHAVTITGAVTVNGQPLPTTSGDRGGLTFTNTAGGGGTLASQLGTSGAATYRARVLAGTYNLDYAANPTLCSGSTAPGIPCTGGSIARDLALTTDGVLDADLKRVMVTGRVTVKGAAMPTATGNRGALVLARADGAALTSASFGTSGDATYTLSLWPGTYDARLSANTGLCAPGSAAPPVPCVGGLLHAGNGLSSDGVLDVDITPVMVSGTVTLNGGALTTEAVDRGSIAFSRITSQGGNSASFSLGTNSAATYAMTVSAGDYIVSHAASALLCSTSRPLPGVPCASQVILGCAK